MNKVYLIPCVIDEKAFHTIPAYITDAVKECQVFFVENERSARRYLKQLWKIHLPGQEIIIDNYEWFPIHKAEGNVRSAFIQKLKEGKNVGIISEAGCPGVADPGQLLVHAAQEINVEVKPLIGPSSILLALMASGMNGQQFQFVGYLPIDNHERAKAIKELETELPSLKEQINKDGIIWVSWYKKSSGKATEVTEDMVRNTALAIGLVDVKVCAVDENWSGLKLVYRLKDR